MKRKITLPLALALLSLLGFAPAARGQQQRTKAAFDTGIVTLGPNQTLRITVGGQGGNESVALGFRRMSYAQGACGGGGVCRLPLNDEDQFPVLTLPPGEAASFDIPGAAFGVRGVVLSGSQNVRVTAQIIDTATGDIIAIWVPQGSPAVGKE